MMFFTYVRVPARAWATDHPGDVAPLARRAHEAVAQGGDRALALRQLADDSADRRRDHALRELEEDLRALIDYRAAHSHRVATGDEFAEHTRTLLVARLSRAVGPEANTSAAKVLWTHGW
jgi:hypothetical protein